MRIQYAICSSNITDTLIFVVLDRCLHVIASRTLNQSMPQRASYTASLFFFVTSFLKKKYWYTFNINLCYSRRATFTYECEPQLDTSTLLSLFFGLFCDLCFAKTKSRMQATFVHAFFMLALSPFARCVLERKKDASRLQACLSA